jgi:hypothetical protein
LTARFHFNLVLIAATALLAGDPARAQFESIFGNGPPRPPADVPAYPNQRDYPRYEPSYPPDRAAPGQRRTPAPSEWRNPDLYPQSPRQPASLPQPSGGRSDEPPAEPLPAPMSLPPSSRPGAGGVQSQDLPPPPGATVAPPQEPAQTQPGQPPTAQPNPVLPGLPPGIRQPSGAPAAANPPAEGQPASPPTEKVVVEPPPQRIANPTAVFNGLDKVSGRIFSFDVAINETVQFGALQVTPRVCYSRPPTETPNTDSFVEVDEVTLKGEIKRIFTGWMFAASPGLHAVEHPIYDVWLTDCKGAQPPAVADATPAPPKPPAAKPPQPARTPAARRPAARAQQDSGAPPSLR